MLGAIMQGHKLKRRVGGHHHKGHHAGMHGHKLVKHMNALRAGKKARHRLPKRHRPRHGKSFDLKKLRARHHKPHNFMEERGPLPQTSFLHNYYVEYFQVFLCIACSNNCSGVRLVPVPPHSGCTSHEVGENAPRQGVSCAPFCT